VNRRSARRSFGLYSPPRVRSSDLNRQQVEHLSLIVKRDLRFYSRLLDRCNQLGFPADDHLLRLIVRARNDLADMASALHYLACEKTSNPGAQKP